MNGPPIVSLLGILGIAGLAVLPGGWPSAAILIACSCSVSVLGVAWIHEASQRAKHRANLMAMAEERREQVRKDTDQ